MPTKICLEFTCQRVFQGHVAKMIENLLSAEKDSSNSSVTSPERHS